MGTYFKPNHNVSCDYSTASTYGTLKKYKHVMDNTHEENTYVVFALDSNGNIINEETRFNNNNNMVTEEDMVELIVTEVEEDSNKVTGDIEVEDLEISSDHRGTVDNPFLFNATNAELEKFILTIMFVAGKNATVQQKKLDQFVECVRRDLGSYTVDTLGVLSAIHNSLEGDAMKNSIKDWLTEVKSGQYGRLTGAIESLCYRIGSGKINLTSCNRTSLVGIKGIGYKSASMFLLYTRDRYKDAVACLDTHIMKYIREELGFTDAPVTTPSLKDIYFKYERIFIDKAKELGKSVHELDFEIWSKYRKN